MNNVLVNWIIRFVKGIFIGSGAILPGVSGGALAAIFGIYEEIINFLSNFRKEFKNKIVYLLPVGLGGIFGVFVLAYPIESLLRTHPVYILLFFMGCIFGTVPLLYRQAGKYGRSGKHLLITIFTATVFFFFLVSANRFLDVEVSKTPLTWVIVGVIFASGLIIPGLSSSNFLIYMNLYEPLTKGISRLDFSILIPVAIGGLLCIISLSKLVNYLMNLYYAIIFHFILGVVIASTLIILPSQQAFAALSTIEKFFSIMLFFVGLVLGLWMSKLELKYKPEN